MAFGAEKIQTNGDRLEIEFIDYAADMCLVYTLVDVEWDQNIGYDEDCPNRFWLKQQRLKPK